MRFPYQNCWPQLCPAQLQFLMEACSLTKTPSENLAQFTGSLSKTALVSLSFSQKFCPAQLQFLMGARSLTKTPFQNLSKFGPAHRQFVPRRRSFNFLTKICPVQLQFLLGKRSATKNFSSNKILPSSKLFTASLFQNGTPLPNFFGSSF